MAPETGEIGYALMEPIFDPNGREWWQAKLVCHLGGEMSLIRLGRVLSYQEIRIETAKIPPTLRLLGSDFLVSWTQGLPEGDTIEDVREAFAEFWQVAAASQVEAAGHSHPTQ
jgi:hypothetical protein